MSTKYSPQQISAAVAALKAHVEKPFVKHQWEEVVYYLSHGNDPRLREQMYREMDAIREKQPGMSPFTAQ
jgi:hypothetical protein